MKFVFFLIPHYIDLMEKNKWTGSKLPKTGVFSGSLIFAALFVLLCAACKSGPSPEAGEPENQFLLRKTALSVLLCPERISGSPRMNLNLSLLDVSGGRERESFFRNLLYEGRSLPEYRDTLIEDWRKAYTAGQDPEKENSGGPRESMNWEYAEYMDFQVFGDRWMAISREKEYYTGGAHGISEKTFYTVDLAERKSLSPRDLFTAPESPELRSLILEALRERAGLGKNAPLSSGVYFKDEPETGGAFFPDPRGLGFHWNPYEIAPYSEGHIEVIIPWEKTEGLLGETGQSLRELFREGSENSG